MSIQPTHSTINGPHSKDSVALSKDKQVKTECQERISSAFFRAAEAYAISHNLFIDALNESKELVSHSPTRSLVPYRDFLEANPKFKIFAFDMAMLYEKAGNKELADEIRKQIIDFTRTSPDSNDMHFLFPPLPGKYPVGIKRYYLEDTSRNELELGHGVDLTRRLEIDVHYPAVQTKEPVYQVHSLYTDQITDPLEKERVENLWDRSQPGLPPSLEEKFPIIIFSHGFGANSNDYQNIVEPLVSHGYCVITVNHPSTNTFTFSLGHDQVPKVDDILKSDTREISINAKDIEFVLNWIKTGRDFQIFLGASFNFDSIGVFGHSLGGIVSLETCRLLPSVIKAGLNMDGGFGYDPHPNIEIKQPFLTIQSNRDLADKEEDENLQQKVEESYQRDDDAFYAFHQRNSHASSTRFFDAKHLDFSLVPAYGFFEASPHFAEIVQRTHKEVLNFFNLHLK